MMAASKAAHKSAAEEVAPKFAPEVTAIEVDLVVAEVIFNLEEALVKDAPMVVEVRLLRSQTALVVAADKPVVKITPEVTTMKVPVQICTIKCQTGQYSSVLYICVQ